MAQAKLKIHPTVHLWEPVNLWEPIFGAVFGAPCDETCFLNFCIIYVFFPQHPGGEEVLLEQAGNFQIHQSNSLLICQNVQESLIHSCSHARQFSL